MDYRYIYNIVVYYNYDIFDYLLLCALVLPFVVYLNNNKIFKNII